VPITFVPVDDAGTMRFAVPVSVNGSPTFLVTIDTGAIGLAVFESSLQGTPVTQTSTPLSITFGGDAQQALTWTGVEARGVVRIGSEATPGEIAFQLVTAASCPSFNPPCGVTSATNHGIGGNLGVGLRAAGYPTLDVYSPIAQLGAPRSDGFTVHVGGLGASQGTLVLGLPAADAGFSGIALSPDTPSSLQNGLSAWQDGVPLCYALNGAQVVPSCSNTHIDTGAEDALVWVQEVPPQASSSDLGLVLEPGVTVDVTDDAGFDLRFTSGAGSADRVSFYSGGDAVSALGLPLFFRYDVEFDIRDGRIAFAAAK
jgi:hypothetical protein